MPLLQQAMTHWWITSLTWLVCSPSYLLRRSHRQM